MVGSIWNLIIPLKIKIFVWLVLQRKVLTKDILLRRGWSSSSSCVFFSYLEIFDHIFIHCSFSCNFWHNFNRFNNGGIFFILESFSGIWESTLYLSIDSHVFAQSLLCIYGWMFGNYKTQWFFKGLWSIHFVLFTLMFFLNLSCI
jgi:zinc-binding in reverse transcriptase